MLDFELSDTVGVEQLKSQLNGFYAGLKIIETDASCGLTTRAIRRDVEATLGVIKKKFAYSADQQAFSCVGIL